MLFNRVTANIKNTSPASTVMADGTHMSVGFPLTEENDHAYVESPSLTNSYITPSITVFHGTKRTNGKSRTTINIITYADEVKIYFSYKLQSESHPLKENLQCHLQIGLSSSRARLTRQCGQLWIRT